MKRAMPVWRVFLPVFTAFCVSLAFVSCQGKSERTESETPQVEQGQSEQPGTSVGGEGQSEHPTEHPTADSGQAEHPTEHPTTDSGHAEHPTQNPNANDQ